MKKIAVMLATGYEEGESLFFIDVLRRAGFTAHSFSTTGDLLVEGCQGIVAKADFLLDESVNDYDMIIIPGGMPGAANLKSDQRVVELVKKFYDNDKYIGTICAGPMVLFEAGITNGKKLTSYPADKYRDMFTEAEYTEELIVVDGKMITSRGPACTLPFAYEVINLLGGDSEPLKKSMLYYMAKDSKF